MIFLVVLACTVFTALVLYALCRHRHRWTAWGNPIQQQRGWPTQTRRCKDGACNRHQIKEVRP